MHSTTNQKGTSALSSRRILTKLRAIMQFKQLEKEGAIRERPGSQEWCLRLYKFMQTAGNELSFADLQFLVQKNAWIADPNLNIGPEELQINNVTTQSSSERPRSPGPDPIPAKKSKRPENVIQEEVQNLEDTGKSAENEELCPRIKVDPLCPLADDGDITELESDAILVPEEFEVDN